MKCEATTKSGEPCPMMALRGGKLCFSHDPENGKAKKEAVTKGGRRHVLPSYAVPNAIQMVLHDGALDEVKTAQAVLEALFAGLIDCRAAQASGYLLRASSDFKESQQLKKRVDVLVEKLTAKGLLND